jgi:hypothetical protein
VETKNHSIFSFYYFCVGVGGGRVRGVNSMQLVHEFWAMAGNTN